MILKNFATVPNVLGWTFVMSVWSIDIDRCTVTPSWENCIFRLPDVIDRFEVPSIKTVMPLNGLITDQSPVKTSEVPAVRFVVELLLLSTPETSRFE